MAEVYEINSVKDWLNIRDNAIVGSSSSWATININCDLDFKDIELTEYSDVFSKCSYYRINGNNHTIKNITFDEIEKSFRFIYYARVIENITFENIYISANGIKFLYGIGEIENIKIKNSVYLNSLRDMYILTSGKIIKSKIEGRYEAIGDINICESSIISETKVNGLYNSFANNIYCLYADQQHKNFINAQLIANVGTVTVFYSSYSHGFPTYLISQCYARVTINANSAYIFQGHIINSFSISQINTNNYVAYKKGGANWYCYCTYIADTVNAKTTQITDGTSIYYGRVLYNKDTISTEQTNEKIIACSTEQLKSDEFLRMQGFPI